MRSLSGIETQLCAFQRDPGPPVRIYKRAQFCPCSSIPYAVRLRQCLVEYNAPANESRRPLFNALKYASSFPVIYLSAAQRLVVSDVIALKGEAAADQPWHGEHHLFRLW